MKRVTLDDNTLALLEGVSEQVELFDRDGILLGYCIPLEAHLHSVDLPGPDPFSDQQTSEMLKKPERGISTEELLRKLRSL